MINNIYKQKIPRDYSYVIKTDQIEEIIKNNDIKTSIHLSYWRRNNLRDKDNEILEANFSMPDHFYGYYKFNIYVHSVVKNMADIIRKQMTESVLPELADWMKKIENIEESSTLFNYKRNFKAMLQDNKVIIDKG